MGGVVVISRENLKRQGTGVDHPTYVKFCNLVDEQKLDSSYESDNKNNMGEALKIVTDNLVALINSYQINANGDKVLSKKSILVYYEVQIDHCQKTWQ